MRRSSSGLVDLAEYIFQSDLHGYEFNRKLSFNDFMKPLGMREDESQVRIICAVQSSEVAPIAAGRQ